MANSYFYDSQPAKKHNSFMLPLPREHHRSHSRYNLDSYYHGLPEQVPMTYISSRDDRSSYYTTYDGTSQSRTRANVNSNTRSQRPRTPSPQRHHWRRRSHRTRLWPPPPSVEDEATSLAKEYPPGLHDKGSEVCIRGTVDQEPIIIDVENRETRFVHIPDSKMPSSNSVKSSVADEKRKWQEKQKSAPPPLRLDVDVDETNLYSRRDPSPYSYTKAPRTPSNRLSAEFFMSPDTLTPPATVHRNIPPRDTARDTIDPHAKRASTKYSSFSRQGSSDESGLDARQTAKLRSRRTTPRVSLAGSDIPERRINRYNSDLSDKEEKRTSKAPPPRSEPVRPNVKIPRSTPSDPVDIHYQHNNIAPSSATTSRNIPLPVPLAKSGRSESVYTSRPSRNEFARSNSSLVDQPVWIQTPPASPKMSTRLVDNSLRGNVSARKDSRPSSRTSSPSRSSLDLNQASYLLSRGTSYQNERSSTYPQSTKERLPRQPGSKLTSSMGPDSVERLSAPPPRIDIKSPSPVRQPLPYPTDELNLSMPSHEMFQIPIVPPYHSRSPSRTPSDSTASSVSSSYLPKPKPSQRPEFPSRHSVAESIPKARMEPSRTASTNGIPRRDFSQPIPVPASLPSCPRKEFTRKYDDWYIVDGNPNFDVCPSCLDEIIRPTPFKSYFRRAPPRDNTVRRRCDFGSPWIRLAWLLTLKQQRQSLELLHGVAAVTGSEPECPGAHEAVGTWYTITDEFGALMPYLTICQRDQRHLGAVFQSLAGIFVRLPSVNSRTPSTCSIRSDSKRFPLYLDLLVDIDDRTRFKDRVSSSDVKPLIDFVRSNAFKSECKQDRIVIDQTWHYIPSLPALSICEECYDDIVLPCIKDGSPLASKFNRVPMPLPPAYENSGCSCQLYSPRMRRVWERAVRRSDEDGFAYLARKVNERREVELDLRRQQVEITRMLDRSSGYGSSSSSAAGGVDREWLKKELERIEQEWLDWE